MRTTLLGILCALALALPARAYITTTPGGGGGSGGPTNGITSATAASMIAGTNAAFTVPQINSSSNLMWRNFTNALEGGTSNAALGTLLVNGDTVIGNGGNITVDGDSIFGGGIGVSTFITADTILGNISVTSHLFTGNGAGLTNIPGSGLQSPLTVPTLNATNFFDFAATNGANQTNFVMLNTNGGFQYGVFDPTTLSWNATTRTLSVVGGTTPNGLVTNLAPADVVVTNAGVSSRMGSNSVSSGTLTANGGASNFLGGWSYVQTNVAPFNVLSTMDGSTTWSAGTLYTNRNTRAFLFMDCNMSADGTLASTVTINYTNSGVAHQTNPNVPINTATTILPVCIPLDPNATFKITTAKGSGGLIILQQQHLEGL